MYPVVKNCMHLGPGFRKPQCDDTFGIFTKFPILDGATGACGRFCAELEADFRSPPPKPITFLNRTGSYKGGIELCAGFTQGGKDSCG